MEEIGQPDGKYGLANKEIKILGSEIFTRWLVMGDSVSISARELGKSHCLKVHTVQTFLAKGNH